MICKGRPSSYSISLKHILPVSLPDNLTSRCHEADWKLVEVFSSKVKHLLIHMKPSWMQWCTGQQQCTPGAGTGSGTVYLLHKWPGKWDRVHPHHIFRSYKAGRMGDRSHGCAVIQRDLSWLENCANRSVQKKQQSEPHSPAPWEGIAPCTNTHRGPTDYKATLQKSMWRCWLASGKWTASHPCRKGSQQHLAALGRALPCRLVVIILHCWALMKLHLECYARYTWKY